MVGSTPVFIGGVACDVTFVGLSSTLIGVVPLLISAGGIVTAPSAAITVQ
jgi:hypothetical protein